MIGGRMMLKNTSGSKVAFRSISFSSTLPSSPRKLYVYVLFAFTGWSEPCGRLPGNLSHSVSGGRLWLNLASGSASTETCMIGVVVPA